MQKRRPKHRKRLRYKLYRGPIADFPKTGPEELLLEYFTDANLQVWQARSAEAQAYHYLWFYELESQRANKQQEITDSLAGVGGVSIDLSNWGRAIKYRYSDTPLSCIGSLKWVGGRFNYGEDIDSARFTPFSALYLAEDLETGMREMHGLTRGIAPPGLSATDLALCGAQSLVWLSVDGNVNNVFDLTTAKNLRAFVKVISGFTLSTRGP